MTQIFLSYRRADKNSAEQVAAYLISEGFDVWWDMELLAGQQFAREIERVIDESQATIVLWSKNAVQSDFVRAEARRALELGKLIPCTLDNVRIPIPFTEIHTARLHTVDEKIENLNEITEALSTKGIHPVGQKISNEDAAEIVSSEPSEWKMHWDTVRALQPESSEEYQKFLDLYMEAAHPEIVSLTKRRISLLSYKVPLWRRKIIYAAAAGIIATFAAGLQISEHFDNSRDSKDERVLIATPKLIVPPNNSIFDNTPHITTLRWQPVVGKTNYLVEVQQKQPDTNQWTMLPNYPFTIKEEYFIFNFPAATRGRWRITAAGQESQKSKTSDWWYFEYTAQKNKLLTNPPEVIPSSSSVTASSERQFGMEIGTLVVAALDQSKEGQYQEAINKLKEGRKLPGLSPYEAGTIEQMLGSFAYELDQYPEAINHFENAINSNGLLADEIRTLDSNVAKLMIGMGKYTEGAKRLENWTKKYGETETNVSLIVQAYVHSNDYSQALPWAEKWFETANPKERKHSDLLLFLYDSLGMTNKKMALIGSIKNQWPSDQLPLEEQETLPKQPLKNEHSILDRDAQPMVRVLPIFPPRFLQGDYSGHCRVRFDVSPEGSTFNIELTHCTAKVLESATVTAVSKWRFSPKVVNGRPVSRKGVENKITYQISDELGRPLPEP